MDYIVTSDKKVCGKTKGDIITSMDIINAGGNEKQLLRLETIKEVKKVAKATPAVQEAPVTQQEEVPVFNSVNNEQGEEPWQE
jgi:hypothetical protein